jgi:hypothetical protein
MHHDDPSSLACAHNGTCNSKSSRFLQPEFFVGRLHAHVFACLRSTYPTAYATFRIAQHVRARRNAKENSNAAMNRVLMGASLFKTCGPRCVLNCNVPTHEYSADQSICLALTSSTEM